MSKLKEAREQAGYTQDRLAREANVSTATVFRAEKGLPISRNNAERIAKVLGIEVTEFNIARHIVRRST